MPNQQIEHNSQENENGRCCVQMLAKLDWVVQLTVAFSTTFVIPDHARVVNEPTVKDWTGYQSEQAY